ncbi:hypothetical protein SESBI_46590 [Sesbania bispinosa]|nr:hypothetical protein SESBI_46590 [Sesbania bispinosa]
MANKKMIMLWLWLAVMVSVGVHHGCGSERSLMPYYGHTLGPPEKRDEASRIPAR